MFFSLKLAFVGKNDINIPRPHTFSHNNQLGRFRDMDGQTTTRTILIAIEAFSRANDAIDVRAPLFSLSRKEKVLLREIQDGVLQAIMSDLESIEFSVMSDQAQTFARSLIADLLDILTGCPPENIAYIMKRLISVYLHLIAGQIGICGEKICQKAAKLQASISQERQVSFFSPSSLPTCNLKK
jgi:hypothetical protein